MNVPVASQDILQSGRRTIRFAAFAMALTGAALFWLGGHIIYSHRVIRVAVNEQLRLKELVGDITYLDEVLTMSARMAAVTGDAKWEQRYRGFETRLDQDIQEAKRLARSLYSEEAAAQTDDANIKLVAMENRAFELVRQGGQAQAAQAVLFSQAYEQEKRRYAQGMQQLTEALTQRSESMVQQEEMKVFWSIGSVVAAIALLLGTWLLVFWMFRGWQARLTEGNRELSRRAEELAGLNATLDHKVIERTADLSKVNTELTAEVAHRKDIEQALARKLAEMETMNAAMMGREERILELKQEINDLCKQIGGVPRYSL